MDYAEIQNAEIVHWSNKAIAVWINGGPHKGGQGIWLPLSQIRDDSPALDCAGPGILYIPTWLAKNKKLI